MKNLKISKIFCIIIFSMILLINNSVYANEMVVSKKEYSEEYKEYLKLTEEEKQKVLMPRMFDIESQENYSQDLKNMKNKLKVMQMLRGVTIDKYNLKDIIPENVKVRNQMNTNFCWAFATIGALESNLAMKNYRNNISTAKIYDFSERHMVYASTERAFNDNKVNPYGFNQKVSAGANSYIATTYLTNGLGAILEEDMPFVNSEQNIDISLIQNKGVATTLVDTAEFPTVTETNKTEVMAQMKSHITNYGGIFATIHGANILSDNFNNDTGAIYCKDSDLTPANHAVLIIGWDDNFNVENFNETCRPENKGAWIIKNSWGEYYTESLSEFKSLIYTNLTQECHDKGWNTAEKIPNEIVKQLLVKEGWTEEKIIIDDTEDIIAIEIGNKGYMYVSYDDVNIYNKLFGIINAKDEKDYDTVYQNDILGYSNAIQVRQEVKAPVYLANVFKRDVNEIEELNKISVYTLQDYTCKVYVNPNGSSKAEKDLQEVKLASGETESFEAGYHTIEFAEPVKLTGDSFVVVLEITNDSDSKIIALESKIENTQWANAIVNSGESFFSDNKINWDDLATIENVLLRGNACIKAYTNKAKSLDSINIIEPPTKTIYVEGDDFNPQGMIVEAIYDDSSKKEITNYNITNGTNLQKGQNSVNISYTENGITKSTTQDITVEEKVEIEVQISNIEVTTKPTKLTYIKDKENLDLTGGKIKATYEDNTTEYVDMTNKDVTVSGFNNSKVGKNTINVYYKNKQTTFEVDIVEEKIEKEAVSSNFDRAEAKITGFKFNGTLTEAYAIIKIKVKGIEIGDESNTYKYYYHLSGNRNETNINNWVEISSDNFVKESDGTYTISIEIDSRDYNNQSKVVDSDKLYVYIKEIASIEQSEKTKISVMELKSDIKVNEDIEDYIEDTINNGGTTTEKDNLDQNTNNGADTTVATGRIPQAGIVSISIISIIMIIIAGISYYKYKNIDR